MMMTLMNGRTEQRIATVELATTRVERRRGLLGRDGIDPGSALVLAPCCSIHTAFMRFAIDVIFVNRSGHVVRIVRDLRAWRFAASLAAYATIELTGDGTTVRPRARQCRIETGAGV